MNKLVELFCDIDDFCQAWEQQCTGNDSRKRRRYNCMSPSEIMCKMASESLRVCKSPGETPEIMNFLFDQYILSPTGTAAFACLTMRFNIVHCLFASVPNKDFCMTR
ncbi:TPA: hypothetical protein N5H07_005103 [Salmonella enterica subsp. enterica serovar Paratyphi B]|nr:hypothetical protein [Salmonella enterica subsp. enterica serovar Paratyphi B]